MAERRYQLSASERDRRILELYQQGQSMRSIARVVGMSASGVCRSLERIERGDAGRDRRAD